MTPQVLHSFSKGIIYFIIYLIKVIIFFIFNLFKLIVRSIVEPFKDFQTKNQSTTTEIDSSRNHDTIDCPSKRKLSTSHYETPTLKKSNTYNLLELPERKNIAFEIFESPEIENPSLFKYSKFKPSSQLSKSIVSKTDNNKFELEEPSSFKFSKYRPAELFKSESTISNVNQSSYSKYTPKMSKTDQMLKSALLSNSDNPKFKSLSSTKLNNLEYEFGHTYSLSKLVQFRKSYSIDDLTCELLIRIFKELDLVNLLNCRMVCKKWSVLTFKSCELNDLCIIDPFIFNRNSTWFHMNKLFNLKNSIYYYPKYPLPSNYLESELFKTLFIKIKYLSLSYHVNENNGFIFEILNRFKYLVHLDIYSLSIRNKSSLNLPNLNTLSIHKFDNKSDLLTINSSKLMYLKCENNLSKLKIKYLNSIKCLETNQCTDNDLRCLKTFTNLEILYCGLENTKIKLDMLPINLKELNLFWDYSSNCGVKDMMFLGDLFDKKSKQLIKINNLEISIDGIRIKNRDILEDFNQSYFDFIRPFLQVKFHSLLVKSPWLKEIAFNKSEYNDVYNCFFSNLEKNEQLCIDLFTKLNNLQTIKIWDIDEDDEDGLLALLRKLTKITYIQFKNVALTQVFYDMLPKLTRQLNYLDIYQSDNEIEFSNFIPEFNYLIKLSTDQKLDSEMVASWLRNNNHFHYVKAKNCDSEYFQIQRIQQFKFKYEYEYNCDSEKI